MPLTHDDLDRLGDRLTRAFQHEVGLSRQENIRMTEGLYKRIDDLKDRQDYQNGRVNKNTAAIAGIETSVETQCQRLDRMEARQDDATRDIAACNERTKNITPTLGAISLNKKQKAGVGSFLVLCVGALAEGLRHHIPTLLEFFHK